MARIRTIKPEFPQSESVGNLSRDARLLFVQLWTIVDDAGRARGAPRLLASLLYPYDADAPDLIEEWLTELEDEGCIRRYLADGSTYLEIVNWLKHQKIDRPSPSRLPPPLENSANPSLALAKDRDNSRGLDADLVPGPSTWTKDQEIPPPAASVAQRPLRSASSVLDLSEDEGAALDVIRDILVDYGGERGLTVGGIIRCGEELNRFVYDGRMVGRLVKLGHLHRDEAGYVTPAIAA